MATKKFIGYTTTAKTVYGIIERQADSYRMNDADGTFAAAPADPYVSFTEHSVIKGEYVLSESRTVWNDGMYKCTVYEQAGGSPAPASDLVVAYQYMYIVSDTEIVNEPKVDAILTDTADMQPKLGTPAGASISADILVIDNFVDELESRCTEARLAELDAANLITDVANIKTDTAAILLDTGTDGVVVAAASKTGYALSTAGVDAILDDVIEGTLTMRQALRLFLSALAGKSSGGGTVTLTFRDNADSKARITATVNASGDRTAMTLDGT